MLNSAPLLVFSQQPVGVLKIQNKSKGIQNL